MTENQNQSNIPYSPQAEESLIGAALINPGVLDLVDINPEDFYIARNRMVWEAMRGIQLHNMTPDIVTLGEALDKSGKLEEIGGFPYLAGLVHDTPSSLGAEGYARIIKDKSARRQAIQIASEIAKAAFSQDQDLDTAISRAMSNLSMAASITKGAVHWSHYINQADAWVQERAKNPSDIWGLKTGFLDFDRITGGAQIGELMVLSGAPGIGKSIFVLQMARNLAGQVPGALYSLEMTGKAVGVRALAMQARVQSRRMKSGKMDGADWSAYYQSVAMLDGLSVFMSDDTTWTTTGLRADLARLKKQHGIQWFVIDYSYLIKDNMGKIEEYERLSVIMAAMKAICKSLDLFGVVIHSLTKAGELRGSRQLEYDADLTLIITEHLPEMGESKDPDLATLTFGKGRELEDSKKYFHLLREHNWPEFKDVIMGAVNLDAISNRRNGKKGYPYDS